MTSRLLRKLSPILKEKQILQYKIFTIEQVISECAIYDIVYVTGSCATFKQKQNMKKMENLCAFEKE